MTSLNLSTMLPTKFTSVFRRHFLFKLEGLDSFLVKKVERAPFIKPQNNASYEERNSHKRLVVTLHHSIAPSTMQQLYHLIKNQDWLGEATILLLDSCGTIISKTVFKGLAIERIDYDDLDYSSNELAEIKLTLSFQAEKLDF